MTTLKAVLSILLFSGMTLKVVAQSELVIFPNIKSMEVTGADARKSVNALSACGFSFRYDSANNNLLLNIHDPRYLPKIFNHKSDKMVVRFTNQTIVLSGKTIREQLIQNYFKVQLPKQSDIYSNIIKKRVPDFQMDDSIGGDHKTLYQHYKNSLSPLNPSGILKKELDKKYRLFKADYRDLIKILNNKYYIERILRKDDGPWSLTFNNVVQDDFTIDFYQKQKKLAELKFDSLYGSPADFLYEYEIADCELFNRYTYFKKIKALGLSKFKFTPYKPVMRFIGFREFTIFFDQNKSDCSFEDIRGIVKLLNDSSYTIQKAKVHAYASVEGDKDNNLRLQNERANVLLDLLQQYNKDSIEIIEVLTDENWKRFYQQIKGTKYKSWSDSSQIAIKKLLAEPNIAISWNDSLAVQRKAVLKLLLFIKADIDLQIFAAIRNYYELVEQYSSLDARGFFKTDEQRIPYQTNIMGVEDYLKQMVRSGNLSMEKFNEIIGYSKHYIFLARFYSMMRDDAIDLPNVYKSKEDVIIGAYNEVLSKIYYNTDGMPRERYLISLAIDIQIYAFERIDQQKLSSEFVCKLIWPKRSVFYPLILNELDYVNEQSEEFIRNLSCYRIDSTENTEIGGSQKKNHHAISFDPPLDYKIPHTSYYFFLKKRILHNDQDIRKLAIRSDDYVEFDLYDLLAYNIFNWDVWNNRYYDDEVDYLRMIQLMNKLVKMNKILCPMQLYQLYLDLHLRVGYLMRHNPDQSTSKEAFNSLRLLHQYYLKNITIVEENDILNLVNHLIWMGKYFYANETYNMARELLMKLGKSEFLSEDNQEIHNRLLGKN